MIPQSFIQELLARVDIVDVVGRYVKLRKGGANWMGLCPFHGEKSPSFSVSPTKQFYHCFGCGAHGSAIGFLMEHLGMSYPDAIRDLAREAGMEVPDDRAAVADAQRRDPGLLDVLAAAARFYKARLRDTPKAIDYLKGRGVSGETAARFGIGYAPDGWRSLEAAVPDYQAAPLVESGLVIEADADGGDTRRKRYDRFRDRVMFPIRNPRGQVIGFGGRVLGKGEPKYLNSPETPLFSKGRELYGLYEARDAIRRAGCVIVVEGYMDVVMLAQHGVAHAVATLGTATTPQHVQKLLRLVDRVVFAFDGDAAGRRAAWRALEACLPLAADTKRIDFLFLPAEHDPDSFVREHGAHGFAEALAGALPLSELLLRELSGRVDLETPEGRARLQADARPLLLAMPEAALRLQLVQAVAAKAGIRAEDLQQYLRAGAAQAGGPWRRDEGAAPGGPGRRGPAAGAPDAGAPDAGDEPWPPGPPPEAFHDRDEGGDHGGGEGAHPDGAPDPDGVVWGGGYAEDPSAGSWGRPGGRRFGRDGGPGGSAVGWRGGSSGSFRGREGGGGRWPDRPGERWGDRWRQMPRPMPVALPDLPRRARLLLALHPGLAQEAWSTDFLPEAVIDWIARLAALPQGAGFEGLLELLRESQPDLAAALKAEADRDGGLIAGLEPDEARREFEGALNRMRAARVREEVDRLAQEGLDDDERRERYAALLSLRRSLTSQGGM